MRLIVITFLFFFISFSGSAQSFELWSSAGVKYKLNKKIHFSGSFSSRFRDFKARTIFPELTVKYKALKWMHLSVDYRFVSKRENNGNYNGANRINFNTKVKNNWDRLSYAMRIRYQMSAEAGTVGTYNSDFDRALRFKPEVSYDIKKSIFTPSISVEFFYNPNSGLYGNRIDKMRYTLGTDLELDGPHSFRIFTRIDHKIYDNNPTKFILGFDYQLRLNDILLGKSKKGEL